MRSWETPPFTALAKLERLSCSAMAAAAAAQLRVHAVNWRAGG